MNPMVSDTVDLQSPDDIALADRMNAGRQQAASTSAIRSRSASAFTRAHIIRLPGAAPAPLR